tara:strand:- start:208 stop:636 length:429 start_codon:yes stop_codon:yes gene_type:complete
MRSARITAVNVSVRAGRYGGTVVFVFVVARGGLADGPRAGVAPARASSSRAVSLRAGGGRGGVAVLASFSSLRRALCSAKIIGVGFGPGFGETYKLLIARVEAAREDEDDEDEEEAAGRAAATGARRGLTRGRGAGDDDHDD